jgi:8-oxo-dGTP pyrophosphatase MutT (NUDIX family)
MTQPVAASFDIPSATRCSAKPVRPASPLRYSSRLGLAAGRSLLRGAYLLHRVYLFFVRPLALGVRVMMIRNGEVLLLRQTYTSGWFMPGGGVDRGETLDAAARREVAEEAGAELHNLSLIGAYTNLKEWKSDHNVLFLSTEFTLSGKPDLEVAELRFFPLDALPEDLWPGHRQRIQEYGEGQVPPQFGEW